MKNDNSTTYTHVSCNKAYLSDAAVSSPDLAGGIYAWKDPGYLLIDKTLVPTAFIDSAINALRSTMVPYGEVLEVDQIFPAEFLHSLKPLELQVLPQVAMHLIERGDMPLMFNPPSKMQANI
jgi:hypothetical protein